MNLWMPAVIAGLGLLTAVVWAFYASGRDDDDQHPHLTGA